MKLTHNLYGALALSCAMLAIATAATVSPAAQAANSATERLLPGVKRVGTPAQSLVTSVKPQRGGGVCGNSILDAGEACDDGNVSAGDGCSATCQIESGFECTLPVPGITDNGVPDGGFEGGTPSATWAETSTNFGSPLCTIATCGNGTGSGPNNGAWWAWFGGIPANEAASLEQTLTIEVTDTTLTFAVEQITCDNTSDYARVLIDGNIVFNTTGADLECFVPGYRTINVNLTTAANGGPYNDGLSHTLRIESETFAFNGDGSNFFFDDITLDRGTTPGEPSMCTELQDICFAEDFNTSGVAGWTIFNNGPLSLNWGTTDDAFCGSGNWAAANYTGGTAVAACVDSDAVGAGVTNSYLCSPSVDLSVAVGSAVDFLYNYQIFDNTAEDAFEVLVGTSPPSLATIGSYSSQFLTTSNAGLLEGAGTSESLDISAFDGNSDVHVCFRHSGDFDWYAQVDDVAVTADSCTGADTDGDGISDAIDNCTLVPNPLQIDTDGDGYGNFCDADFNNNCVINAADLGIMKFNFFGTNPLTDLNSDGSTNAGDLGILKAAFFGPPGPSAADPCIP